MLYWLFWIVAAARRVLLCRGRGRLIRLGFLSLAGLGGTAVQADSVTLVSGDHLTGTLRELDTNFVVIDTPYASQLRLPRGDVVALSTSRPVALRFTDGSYVTGELQAAGERMAVLTATRFGTTRPFPLADIARLLKETEVESASPIGTLADALPGQAPEGLDRVVLTGGEVLHGRIEQMEDGELTLNTEYAGTLTLSQGNIASITTTTPVTVKTADGRYLTETLDNRSTVGLSQDSQIPLTAWAAIYRDDPQTVERRRQKPRFSGNANVGIRHESGNTRTEEYHLDTEVVARTPVNRYTAGLELNRERSEGKKVDDDTLVELQFDHFLTPQWYLFNSASFEQDEVDALDLRSAVSAGVGYQFYENEQGSLSTEAGITYVNEDFENDTDDSYTGGRWALDLDRLLTSWVAFFHHQEGLFGLTDTSNVTIRTRTGFRFPFGNGFQATAQANIDWDRTPAKSSSSTDKEYLFTLGYSW